MSLPELEPRVFSFNSPHGACPRCTGLGAQLEIDPDLLVPDTSLSIDGGRARPVDDREPELLRQRHRGDRRALRDLAGHAVARSRRRSSRTGSCTARAATRSSSPTGTGWAASASTRWRSRASSNNLAAPLPRDRLVAAARPHRGVHELPRVPRVRRRAAQARGARGHDRRPVDPRVLAAVGDRALRFLDELELTKTEELIGARGS